MKILVLGLGPCGLGAMRQAAHYLNNISLMGLDRSTSAGGLASSFVDHQGFTWDIGGHVQFSHYKYFDDAMISFLGEDG